MHPIAALQSEYSLWTRDPEETVIATLRALGIGLVAYSPLGRGFLTGTLRTQAQLDALDADDYRRNQQRVQGDNLAANVAIVERIDQIAAAHDATPAQVALAWVHAKGEDIVPIPGTKRRRYLEENAASADVELSTEDLARIEAELPSVAGDRYEATGMSSVNL